MALGTTVTVDSDPRKIADQVCPTSVTSVWSTIIDAGGMDQTDNSGNPIRNPTASITDSTRHIFQRRALGTLLLLRLVYDDGITGVTDPVVAVFGRTKGQVWQLLKTRALAITGTIATSLTTDVTDGTNNYTTPDYSTTCWDCLGCDEILVGVQTALAAGVGTVATAYLEGKFI